MDKKAYKLINLEGVDGTGKHTVALELKSILEKEGKSVFITDFPRYDTPTGKVVKEFLMGNIIGDPKKTDAYAASIFYAADRIAYFHNNIEKLKQYDYIISDRSYMSNLFFQASKMIEGDINCDDNTTQKMNILLLRNYLNSQSKLEISSSWLYKFIGCLNINSFYLYHPDINMNMSLINKRYASDPSRIPDLNENREYLEGINNFALKLYDAIQEPNSAYRSLFAMNFIYYYETIQCSSREDLYEPNDIAQNILSTIQYEDNRKLMLLNSANKDAINYINTIENYIDVNAENS